MDTGTEDSAYQSATLASGEEAAFDHARFQNADERVTHEEMDDPRHVSTIQAELENHDQAARDAYCEDAPVNPVVRTLLWLWVTLAGKDSVSLQEALNTKATHSVGKNETLLKQINQQLARASNEYQNTLLSLHEGRDKFRDYEFARDGYSKAISEIEQIVAAKYAGRDAKEIALTVLDASVCDLRVQELERRRIEYQTKIRHVDVSLSKTQYDAVVRARSLESLEKAIGGLNGQYSKIRTEMSSELAHLGKSYSPNYFQIMRNHLAAAKIGDETARVIERRDQLALKIDKDLSGRIDTILAPHKAPYYATNRSGAAQIVDDGLAGLAEQGEVCAESLRTEALAAFNKYLG